MAAAMWIRVILLAAACLLPLSVEARVRHYKFNVVMKNATRLCSTKPIVTINGKFPGPTIYAREMIQFLVKVVNHVKYNVSIHWHGVRQLRTGWADGPAYITQCPIQPGQVYVYNFTLTGQRGTLWWHAHILWLRATVHGALVILPKLGVPYPFPRPHMEQVIVLGPVQGCQSQGGFNFKVEQGNTYLLRIVNAALNEELFFKIAGHQLTVVEVDAVYTKPFKTDTIVIAPGQTTNVLLTTNRGTGKYLVAASPFMDAPILVDNITASATLHYSNTPRLLPHHPHFPPSQERHTSSHKLHRLSQKPKLKHLPLHLVPLKIDHSLFFTVSLGINPCATCANGSRVVADFNNVSFVMPQDLSPPGTFLQHKRRLHRRFPREAPGDVQLHRHAAGELRDDERDEGVQARGTSIKKDPKKFNLVDPVERNTVGVPAGGWTAIRSELIIQWTMGKDQMSLCFHLQVIFPSAKRTKYFHGEEEEEEEP
ncbi:laccase-4-like isoform X2 [Senna tora]|uniref:laccase n=1 Tax=Senna tora TaxID=362788 RepID=A0A834VYE5_9FABA|nr:laccase-4-like isoform X2 [Senna tora]